MDGGTTVNIKNIQSLTFHFHKCLNTIYDTDTFKRHPQYQQA